MNTKTDCNCSRCAALCTGRPGIFAPGEATRAAAHFGLTLREFFKRYLTIDWYTHEDALEQTDFLVPAWDVERARDPLLGLLIENPEVEKTPMAGRRTNFFEGFTRGRCALLGEKGCTLPFELRPAECRAAYACERGDPERGQIQHTNIVEEWSHKQTSGELAHLRESE